MKTETQVKNKVKMSNVAKKIANIEANKVALILTDYVGCKVQKADDSLVKKITDRLNFDRDIEIEPLDRTGNDYAKLHCVYIDTSAYSLYMKVSICYNGGSYEASPSTAYCYYEEFSTHIADVEGGMLKSIDVCRADILDADKQIKLFKAAYKAKEQYETARDKVNHSVRYWAGLKDVRI